MSYLETVREIIHQTTTRANEPVEGNETCKKCTYWQDTMSILGANDIKCNSTGCMVIQILMELKKQGKKSFLVFDEPEQGRISIELVEPTATSHGYLATYYGGSNFTIIDTTLELYGEFGVEGKWMDIDEVFKKLGLEDLLEPEDKE